MKPKMTDDKIDAKAKELSRLGQLNARIKEQFAEAPAGGTNPDSRTEGRPTGCAYGMFFQGPKR